VRACDIWRVAKGRARSLVRLRRRTNYGVPGTDFLSDFRQGSTHGTGGMFVTPDECRDCLRMSATEASCGGAVWQVPVGGPSWPVPGVSAVPGRHLLVRGGAARVDRSGL